MAKPTPDNPNSYPNKEIRNNKIIDLMKQFPNPDQRPHLISLIQQTFPHLGKSRIFPLLTRLQKQINKESSPQ